MKPSASSLRRLQWVVALAVLLAAATTLPVTHALARDGETSDDGSDSDSRSDERDNGGSTGKRTEDDGKDDHDGSEKSSTTSTGGSGGITGGAATGLSGGASASLGSSAEEAGEGKKDELDQEEVRAAVLSGAIMPLARVLPVVQQAVAGSVIDITLVEDMSGSWIYEIGVMNDDGVYKDVIIDARDSRLLAVRNR